MQHVNKVAETIGNFLDNGKIIITKATIPVGTTHAIENIISNKLKNRGLKHLSFHIASNPEFLREGTAVNDFFNPDRIIVGTDSEFVKKVMKILYSPFLQHFPK